MKLRSRLLDFGLLSVLAAGFLPAQDGLFALASVSVSVPEPATLALLAVGLGGIGAEAFRRSRKDEDS